MRVRSAVLWLGAILAILAAAECRPASSPPRNLIVISIDTLRADALGCYGNERETSPGIDRIAANGVLFEDASATSPWTKPSHASLLTGLYPRRHGARSMEAVMATDAVHLASWLAERGFQTAAVVNSRYLTSHGLENGFIDFTSIDYIQGQRHGSPVTGAAIDWLKNRDATRRFFLLVHYMDVHSDYASLAEYEQRFVEPYDGPFTGSTRELYRVAEGDLRPDPSDIRHLRNLYDAGVRQIDDRIEQLLGFLKGEGLLEDSLLVITSDHGEEFMEHGGVLHGFSQHQEVIRIPLIFHGPGIPEDVRVSTPASLVDVLSTSLTALDVESPDDVDGAPLQETWSRDGTVADRFLYAEADISFPPPGRGAAPLGPHRAARNDRYRLHYQTDTQTTRLFDLANDPGEQIDVAAQFPGITETLRDRLLMWLDASITTPERALTDEELDRLRSLGYVGQ